MRLTSVLKVAVVAGFGVAVLAIGASKSIDTGLIKAAMIAELKAATGRDLTIAGGVRLKVGLVPVLVAEGVSLSNRPGGSRPDMIRVDKVEAELALLPLLKREIRVIRVVVSGPDILLETGADGSGNWMVSPGTAEPAKTSKASVRFNLREFKVKNARVWIHDGDGPWRQVNLHKLTFQPERPGGGPVTVQLVADHHGKTVELVGNMGSLDGMRDGKPWPIRLKASSRGIQAALEGSLTDPLAGKGGDFKLAISADEVADIAKLLGHHVQPMGPFRLSARAAESGGAITLTEIDSAVGRRDTVFATAKGSIRDLFKTSGIELAVVAESDNLAGLSKVVGHDVPSMGPVRTSAMLRGGDGEWRLSDLKASLASSDISGEAAWEERGRPRLSAQLIATSLSLVDFATPAARHGEKLESRSPARGHDGRLFPDLKFSPELMRRLDLDVALHVGSLSMGGLRLSDAAIGVRLDDGHLTLAPLRAGLAGGALDGQVELRTKGAFPSASLALKGTHLDLGRLARDAGWSGAQSIRTDLMLELAGRGDTLRSMLAGANGRFLAQAGDGRLENGGDFRCAVVRGQVRDGVFVSDQGIAVEMETGALLGGGSVDLGQESVDLVILPQDQGERGLVVNGPLGEPTVSWRETGPARLDGAACQVAASQPRMIKPKAVGRPSR